MEATRGELVAAEFQQDVLTRMPFPVRYQKPGHRTIRDLAAYHAAEIRRVNPDIGRHQLKAETRKRVTEDWAKYRRNPALVERRIAPVTYRACAGRPVGFWNIIVGWLIRRIVNWVVNWLIERYLNQGRP